MFKQFFDIFSHCGEAALQPDAPFFIPAQAAAGLVLFHCTGSRPPAGTAFSLGGLLTSSSTEQRTPSTCDRYLWDCFSSVGHRCLIVLQHFISYFCQASRQHAAIGCPFPEMPRWGLNSNILYRCWPFSVAVRPIPRHGVASIFSNSLSLVPCFPTLGAVFSRC